MTEQEFRRKVDEFWSWTSKRDRPLTHWLMSIEEWAREEYHEAYEKEANKSA